MIIRREESNMKKKIFAVVLIIAGAFTLSPISNRSQAQIMTGSQQFQASSSLSNGAHSVKGNYPELNKTSGEKTSEISIISIGDILFHMPEVEAAKENGNYNFKPMFSDVKDIISSKDVAVANFESTINPNRNLSGYPSFNTPVQALDALKDVGLDVLLSDNNHSLDTGVEGIKSTNRFMKQYGFKVVGSGEPNEDKSTIVEKNGIKLGLLSYTYGTNFGKQYSDMINYIDENNIKRDIDAIKSKCDFIIVYLHVGTEYVRTVEPFQADLINNIASMGADAILCSHPHVARKSEVLNVNGREVFVNYSMGNFISNQNSKYTDIGSMVDMKIFKTGNNTQLDYAETIPVYRLRYKSGGKTIFKTVLSSNIENFNKIIGASDISYVKQVSGELAYKYEATQTASTRK